MQCSKPYRFGDDQVLSRLNLWFCVILLSISLFCFSAVADVKDVKVESSASGSQVLFKLSKKSKYSHFTLKNPNRVVLDIKGATGTLNYRAKGSGELIKRIRNSTPKTKQDSRFVLEVAKLVDYEITHLSRPDGPYIQVKFDDPQPISAMITSGQTERDDDIIIAIDAGHGGRVPGSIGPQGTYEKNITLAIEKNLQKRFNAEPGLRAVLTRDADYYISPSKRPLIARKKKADLLISIHADAFHTPQPRGASVWTINNGRAQTEFARLLENKSRQSELLAGANTVIAESEDDNASFVRTILDMTKDATRKSSYDASDYIISELKKVTKMHKKERQYASLAVLTAQDIPSILVEVGFISNPTEEKNLNWSKYRQRLADSIFTAVSKYFKVYPPDGSLWARLNKTGDIKHVVKAGESLYKIAKRYDISIAQIKQANNLKRDSLKPNQTLLIPKG